MIKSANRDLILAVGSGFSASQDALHTRVVANRFADDHSDWRLQGYALPILIPNVADVAWTEIVAIRKEKGLQQLRGVLAEIESETMEVAVKDGDLEESVHRALEKHLGRMAAKSDSLGNIAKRTMLGLVIGVSSGLATVGLTGPAGILASSSAGSVIGAALDARAVIRDRGARQWIAVMNRIKQSAEEQVKAG